MREDEVIQIFRDHLALLEGHFILSSGLHSDRYIQCALVLQHPRIAERLGAALASRLTEIPASVIVAPALGGILVAHEVARALGVRALFTERQGGPPPVGSGPQGGRMSLRRGFGLAAGESAVVVEDVLTTGGSTRETMACVEDAGGKVVAAGALIDRSGGAVELGVPRQALVTLTVRNYTPAECPLCREGIPAVKPGSRPGMLSQR
jgi:orotate phosphoribosyltransferase